MSQNFDPQSPEDWAVLEQAIVRAFEITKNHLNSFPEQPVWQPSSEAAKKTFVEPLSDSPSELAKLVDDFGELLLPFANGNLHPRFFGWVHGGGNLYGALGEFCAALLNANLGGRDHLAHQVEKQVIQWSRELFGFPLNSSGLLTSGTSMATVLALAVARQQAAGFNLKSTGLQRYQRQLVGYTSCQGHNSITKAFQLLGLGSEALRPIAVKHDHSINTLALREQVAADKAAGLQPFCVIATLGSVNTGAIDDLNELQAICSQEGLWLHVDAAFGAAVALLDEFQEKLRGLPSADSIAFDFHKWFQVPYAVGCLLVKDSQAHQATFSESKEYLASDSVGLAAGAPWPCDFGMELSRGFLALKVWFTFRALGKARMTEVVRKHCQLAQAMAEHIKASDELELKAPVAMNIVCLRYVPKHCSGQETAKLDYLDALNKAIVVQLQEQGIAAPSTTRLNKEWVIRIALVNHRTEWKDLLVTLEKIQKLGVWLDQQFDYLLQPTHWHLMQGGDERLYIDDHTKLNRYGCSPLPREALTFASSTATSISTHAYHLTESYHQQLLHACLKAQGSSALQAYYRALEERIAHTFGFAHLAADIHLTPSGTDAQLLAVAAITTAKPGQWLSLVCGSDETGSGTPYSVTGCHFDDTSCLDLPVNKGELIDGMQPIAFKGVPFRKDSGQLLSSKEMDEQVALAVSEAIQQGYSVILHAMDQSKLGCWSPSANLLDQLRQTYPEQLQVIVDACQLRLDSEDLCDYLCKGDVVLLTGSKFFTGPPFSGVAIFAQDFTKQLLASDRLLPKGLTDYIPQAQLGLWEDLLPDVKSPLSIGLLLRWYAALSEADRYFRVPQQERIAVVERFGAQVAQMIDQHPYLELLHKPHDDWWARSKMLGNELSSQRTIFPFFVQDASGQYLSEKQVKRLYVLLNQDIGEQNNWTAAQLVIAVQACHLGQPVVIKGKDTAVLRISVGARIVSDGYDKGHYRDQHLTEELRQIQLILDKISLCVESDLLK